jgi:hypothetical protein
MYAQIQRTHLETTTFQPCLAVYVYDDWEGVNYGAAVAQAV